MASDEFKFAAFDPGVKGGYSFWQNGSLKTYAKIPQSDLDLLTHLMLFKPHVIIVEKLHAGPKQGSSKAFTFGRQYQRILSLAMSVVFERCIVLVTPIQWQQTFGFVRPDNKPLTYSQKKSLTLKTAKEFYPDLELTQGTADAVLIGHWFNESFGSLRSQSAVNLYSGVERENLNVRG